MAYLVAMTQHELLRDGEDLVLHGHVRPVQGNEQHAEVGPAQVQSQVVSDL